MDRAKIYPIDQAIPMLARGQVVPFWLELPIVDLLDLSHAHEINQWGLVLRVEHPLMAYAGADAFKLEDRGRGMAVLMGLEDGCSFGSLVWCVGLPQLLSVHWSPNADGLKWLQAFRAGLVDRMLLAVLPGVFHITPQMRLEVESGELLAVGLSPHLTKGTKLEQPDNIAGNPLKFLLDWADRSRIWKKGADGHEPPFIHLIQGMFVDADTGPAPASVDDRMLEALNRNTAALERVALVLERLNPDRQKSSTDRCARCHHARAVHGEAMISGESTRCTFGGFLEGRRNDCVCPEFLEPS